MQESIKKMESFLNLKSEEKIKDTEETLIKQFEGFFIEDNLNDQNICERELAMQIESQGVNKNNINDYLSLLSYLYYKKRLTEHQTIFLVFYITVKEHVDNQIHPHLFQRMIELGIIEGLAYIAPPDFHTEVKYLLHTLGQGYFEVLKKILSEKILHKEQNIEILLYKDFKTFFLEYISEIKLDIDKSLFEKYGVEGIDEWIEKSQR